MTSNLRTIPPNQWVPIAYRAREDGVWVEIPDAPLSIAVAHKLEHDDLIYMATRPEAAAFALVVRRRVA